MCALRIWVLQLVAIVENGADVTVGLANGRDQGIGRACIDNEAITVLRQPECRKGSRKEAEEGYEDVEDSHEDGVVRRKMGTSQAMRQIYRSMESASYPWTCITSVNTLQLCHTYRNRLSSLR